MIGVSPDEVEAVKKFDEKYDLDFTLLADADHAVADAYGAWVEKSMYGKKYMGVQRATFLIDPDGKIAKVFPKVSPKTHDDVVLFEPGSSSRSKLFLLQDRCSRRLRSHAHRRCRTRLTSQLKRAAPDDDFRRTGGTGGAGSPLKTL